VKLTGRFSREWQLFRLRQRLAGDRTSKIELTVHPHLFFPVISIDPAPY
jgi:hypothetical protein